ncbi:MAG: anthranilate phosphoribosyltransferase [Euryarchaeota archaeon]|nr:anthranilate phosphoribosyltransferase [Euryarchaeota archaeon]
MSETGPAHIREPLTRVVEGHALSESQAEAAMDSIMAGGVSHIQLAAFLTALRMKGETVEEITGFARSMRRHCSKIHPKVEGRLIDTCGTGGAGIKLFNVSTIAAFVAAGAGAAVAKHGNRSATRPSGSADVLEALGADIGIDAARVAALVERIGIGFVFAPNFHPAIKHAMPVRKDLGLRTVYNILGPLTNPANAKGQVLGVFAEGLVMKLAPVLNRLGAERAVVVHGRSDGPWGTSLRGAGMDEISLSGETVVGLLERGEVTYFTITPEEFGLERHDPGKMEPLAPRESASLAHAILDGKEKGPRRDIVLLNAAAAIYVAGKADSMKDGLVKARESLDSGRAAGKLAAYVAATREV